MVNLNDLQLASLIEEIGTSMELKIPIVDAMDRFKDRRMGAVAKAAAQLSHQINLGRTPADAIRQNASPRMQQVAAAVETCERTNSSALLFRHAKLLRTRYEHRRLSRVAWLYPVMLLAIGYSVGYKAMAPVIQQQHGNAFSKDPSQHGIAWDDWIVAVSDWVVQYQWTPLIVLAVVGVIIAIWSMLRKKLSQHAASELFCESLADQVQNGVPESDAIHSAAMMAGDDALFKSTDPTLKAPAVQAYFVNVKVPGLPDNGASDEYQLNESEKLVARLRFASSIHHQAARRHNYLWAHLIPRIMVVMIGCGFTLAYAWYVIRPIYQQVAQW